MPALHTEGRGFARPRVHQVPRVRRGCQAPGVLGPGYMPQSCGRGHPTCRDPLLKGKRQHPQARGESGGKRGIKGGEFVDTKKISY